MIHDSNFYNNSWFDDNGTLWFGYPCSMCLTVDAIVDDLRFKVAFLIGKEIAIVEKFARTPREVVRDEFLVEVRKVMLGMYIR